MFVFDLFLLEVYPTKRAFVFSLAGNLLWRYIFISLSLQTFYIIQYSKNMESKVSEGGLNVTLTIRLLMHGKVSSTEVFSCHYF